MARQVARRVFTVGEFHRMGEAGIFSEDDRVELLDGEIVEMTPIGSRHAATVARLTALFACAGNRAIVWVQNPIRLDEHCEPQPDVALLKPRPDFYAAAHPGPADVLLVVEVAETSVAADRAVKVPLYARHGVPEMWLVDLEGGCLELYREPSPDGYKQSLVARRGEQLSPQKFPDLQLAAADVLG